MAEIKYEIVQDAMKRSGLPQTGDPDLFSYDSLVQMAQSEERGDLCVSA